MTTRNYLFIFRKWLLRKQFSKYDEFCRDPTDRQILGEEAKSQETELSIQLAKETMVLKELEVCQMAAERYASNYNAWSHRIWSLQQIANNISSEVTAGILCKIGLIFSKYKCVNRSQPFS